MGGKGRGEEEEEHQSPPLRKREKGATQTEKNLYRKWCHPLLTHWLFVEGDAPDPPGLFLVLTPIQSSAAFTRH